MNTGTFYFFNLIQIILLTLNLTAIEIHMYGLKIFVKENKKKINSDIYC